MSETSPTGKCAPLQAEYSSQQLRASITENYYLVRGVNQSINYQILKKLTFIINVNNQLSTQLTSSLSVEHMKSHTCKLSLLNELQNKKFMSDLWRHIPFLNQCEIRIIQFILQLNRSFSYE